MTSVSLKSKKSSLSIKFIDLFETVGSDYLDNYLSALFYKGVIHRLMGQLDEAKQSFNKILEEYILKLF